MRSNGLSVDRLRNMQHDIAMMIDEAGLLGLVLPRQAVRRAATIKERNDYVRVRYMVVEEKGALTAQQALEFASDIREAVRTALDFDEFGNPRGRHWMVDEPADYLEAGNRPG